MNSVIRRPTSWSGWSSPDEPGTGAVREKQASLSMHHDAARREFNQLSVTILSFWQGITATGRRIHDLLPGRRSAAVGSSRGGGSASRKPVSEIALAVSFASTVWLSNMTLIIPIFTGRGKPAIRNKTLPSNHPYPNGVKAYRLGVMMGVGMGRLAWLEMGPYLLPSWHQRGLASINWQDWQSQNGKHKVSSLLAQAKWAGWVVRLWSPTAQQTGKNCMNATAHSGNTKERKLQLVEALLEGAGVKQVTQPAVARRENLKEFPLSFAQQRLWLLDQLEPGPQYNDPFHLRLTGSLDVVALSRSLNEIVRRHEALRARFLMVDDQPKQQVVPPARFKIPFLDLSGLTEIERESQAIRMAAEEGRCEFKLEHGPLFRVKLLKLGPAEHWLLLTFHHVAMDGWSRGVFLRELAALYSAFISGQPSPLPELAIQYADFAAWQRSQSQALVFERDLNYWKQELGGTSSRLEWPTDFPRPKTQSFRGARLEITIDAALVQALLELRHREGCTLFMVLLAAFQILALRYTGQEEIFVGSPVANRNRAEIEGLIGYFLNTLVFRADLAGEPTFREALRRVRETAVAAYAHQDLPYERLVEELKPSRDTSYNPVFQVMFIFQNTPQPVSKAKDLSLSSFEVHNGTSKCDLTLNLAETAAGLEGWIEYATDLFTVESMMRLRGHFQTLLKGIVHDPDQPITRLPILTEAEKHQFSGWNCTDRQYRSDVCVHELIEAQSARIPAAVAVGHRW